MTEAVHEQSKRQPLKVIQAMRGIAAFAVVLYHAHIILAQRQYGSINVYDGVVDRGWIGVNFFFVLSGFIILLAHEKDIGRRERIGEYLRKRFVRVYPVYWVFTGLYVLAALFGLGQPEFGTDFRNLIASITLLPLDPAPVAPLQVAWTLFYEIMFYGVFISFFFGRTFGIAAFSIWSAIIMLNFAMSGDSGFGPLNMFNASFMFGMLAFLAFKTAGERYAWPLIGAGVAAIATAWWSGILPDKMSVAQHSPLIVLLMACLFSLVIAGFALLERSGRLMSPWSALLVLGNASYSVYLIHSPVISVAAGINRRLFADMLPGEILFWSVVAISTGAGILAHFAVEQPLIKYVRRLIDRRAADALHPAQL